MSSLSRLAIIATVVLLLSGALPASSGAEDGDEATVAVLFDFGNGRTAWGFVPQPDPANAWCGTVDAAEQLEFELDYTYSQFGVFLKSVDGVDTPEDFSSYWGLWSWSVDEVAWTSSMVGAQELQVEPGDAVAWRFGAFGEPGPDPNPVTLDPWSSFRGGKHVQGLSASPRLPAAAEFWAEDLGNGPIDSTLAVADGKVFGISSGIYDWSAFEFTQLPAVFALDAFSGQLLWDHEFEDSGGFEIGSPAYHDGMLYATLSSGRVVALDADDGDLAWDVLVDGEGLSSSPTVFRGRVLTGTEHGRLVALHAGNGTTAWEANLPGGVYMAQPTVHDGVVYVGTENGTFHAVSLDNGSAIWTFEREGRFRGTPLVVDGSIYIIRGIYEGFIAKEGFLLALDTDGGLLWERDIGTTGSSPAVLDDTVVVGSSGGLRAFTTSGEAMWYFQDGGTVTSSPAVAGDRIYFITNVNDPLAGLHTSVYALHADGYEDWRKELRPHNWALSSVAIADGRIYVATDAGWVYSLGDTSFTADFTWVAEGGHVSLNDTSESFGADLLKWVWNVEGTGLFETQNVSVQINSSGDHPVTLLAYDQFGRKVAVTKNVTVVLPDLTAGFTHVVDGKEVTLTANETAPDLVIPTFSWQIEGVDAPVTGATVTHVFERAGTYGVTLTITDEYGRQSSASQDVTVRRQTTDEGGLFGNPVVLYGALGVVVILVIVGLAITLRGGKGEGQ